MAAATSVTVKLSVTGSELVTQIANSRNIDLKEKAEYDISLTNSQKEIDFSYIDNIDTIIFITEDDIKLELTISSEVVEFEINGLFVLNPTDAWLATLDSVIVKNDKSTEKTVKVRVYGASS